DEDGVRGSGIYMHPKVDRRRSLCGFVFRLHGYNISEDVTSILTIVVSRLGIVLEVSTFKTMPSRLKIGVSMLIMSITDAGKTKTQRKLLITVQPLAQHATSKWDTHRTAGDTEGRPRTWRRAFLEC
ncbi:unnamed protein product, partial [Ectocarpus sp. 8 AP-2014]